VIPTHVKREFSKQMKAGSGKESSVVMQGVCLDFSPQRGPGHIKIFRGERFIPAVFLKRGENFYFMRVARCFRDCQCFRRDFFVPIYEYGNG
jgi:hypothetical protein